MESVSSLLRESRIVNESKRPVRLVYINRNRKACVMRVPACTSGPGHEPVSITFRRQKIMRDRIKRCFIVNLKIRKFENRR